MPTGKIHERVSMESQPTSRPHGVGQELPSDLKPDFAPLKELERDNEQDPYHQDSVLAHQAFDQAVEAGKQGDEKKAVAEYLRASKLAETAREWYLAAVSFHRVGDFLQHPKPPTDLQRAFRMYQRAIWPLR